MKSNADILLEIQNLDRRKFKLDTWMTNIVQILHHERRHFNWVGIYLLQNDVLILGPYVGKPSPHTHIPLNKGICGAAASQRKTIIIDDVNSDPRYLACSIETRSEIVVPILYENRVLGEIDIDSDMPVAFTDKDKELIEAVASLVAKALV